MPARRRVLSRKDGHKLVRQRLASFSQKFGRDPIEGEPLVFDHEAPRPQSVDQQRWKQEIVQDLVRANIDQAIIYAFGRTGVLAIEGRVERMKAEELAAWDAAIDEYQKSIDGPLQ